MSETCKRRCLIVGMGGISRGMHASLRTKPWYECCGVVDVTDARLPAGREVAGLQEAALFKDLGRALAELKLDAVLINTPSELHFAQARQCLEAGRHVRDGNPVRFEKEIKVTIEHGHANHLGNEMASVAYWYAERPAAAIVIPPVEKRRRVPKVDGKFVIPAELHWPGQAVKVNPATVSEQQA
jgi:hypothetical protein